MVDRAVASMRRTEALASVKISFFLFCFCLLQAAPTMQQQKVLLNNAILGLHVTSLESLSTDDEHNYEYEFSSFSQLYS